MDKQTRVVLNAGNNNRKATRPYFFFPFFVLRLFVVHYIISVFKTESTL